MYQISDYHIYFDLNVANSTNFKSVEVVDCGSVQQNIGIG